MRQGSAIDADDHDGPLRRNRYLRSAPTSAGTGPLLHDTSDRHRRADAEDLEDRTARRPTQTGTCSTEPAWLPRLFFTETGLAALRTMMRDRRLADPERFAHIRVELGIDPPTEAKAAE
jgi:hypothetical protein